MHWYDQADPNDLWYRCEVNWYSVADDWGDHSYSTQRLDWTVYKLVRSTPRGVWLRGFLTGDFFVLGDAKRQRACPTKETALADAIARKERHVWGCKARLQRAEKDLTLLQTALRGHTGLPPFTNQEKETLDG